MTSNIRSLHSRLRRLERKSGAGSAREFYDKLSEDELWAILGLPIRQDYEEEIDYFAVTLDIPQKNAEALVVGLDQVRHSLVRDFRHLSDGELVELINAPRKFAAVCPLPELGIPDGFHDVEAALYPLTEVELNASQP